MLINLYSYQTSVKLVTKITISDMNTKWAGNMGQLVKCLPARQARGPEFVSPSHIKKGMLSGACL